MCGAFASEAGSEVALPFARSELPTIGVMNLEAKGGFSQEKADILIDILSAGISRLGTVEVVTKSDFLSVLHFEKQKRLAGCDDEVCVSEIAGALGVEWLVTGNVSRFGKELVLNLKLIRVRYARVHTRVFRRVAGGEELLMDEVPGAIQELFEPVADRMGLTLGDARSVIDSASKHRQPVRWSPSATTVFTRREILSSGAESIVDLLRQVPGFDVFEVNPSFPVVGCRALTGTMNHLVLLVVDGREVMNELTGIPFWSLLTFDLNDVERVEVVRGPTSALYGTNSISAVVSVTTVPGSPSRRSGLHLSAGEPGAMRLRGSHRHIWRVGAGSLVAGVGLQANQRASPSDRRNLILGAYSAGGHLRYRRGKSFELSLTGGALAGQVTMPIAVSEMRLEDGRNYWLMGKSRLPLSDELRLKAQLYYSHYGGVGTPRAGRVAFGEHWLFDMPRISWNSSTVDAQLQLDWWATGSLFLIAGISARYSHLNGRNLILPVDDESRGAGFVHAEWDIAGQWKLSGGLRLDLSSVGRPALSPRTAVVFAPWRNHYFRLTYGMAFRKPSFFEGHIHLNLTEFNQAFSEVKELLAERIGNPDLENELVHTLETGWQGRFLKDRIIASISLYVSWLLNSIYFDNTIGSNLGMPDLANAEFRYANLAVQERAVGFEAELTWRINSDLQAWTNLTARSADGHNLGYILTSVPLYRFNLGVRFMPALGPRLDLSLHYTSSYNGYSIHFDHWLPLEMGNSILLISRLGYRMALGPEQNLEAGLSVRIPLTGVSREVPGWPTDQARTKPVDSNADLGGEMIVRVLSAYLRASF